jgi:sialidase-1
MTVRISHDNGNTWKVKNVLHQGPAAYSNLVVLPNGNLACLYEAGVTKAYEGIVFEELSFSDFK